MLPLLAKTMYNANNTPGIQAKMVKTKSIKKVPPNPSAIKTARGGNRMAILNN